MLEDKPKKQTRVAWTEERKQARRDMCRKRLLDAAEHVRQNRLKQKQDNE